MECKRDGCLELAIDGGFCRFHRVKVETCSVEGCPGTPYRRGMCSTHYRADLREKAPPCSVEGCGKPVVARGLCDTHRLRKEHHGHLNPTRPADWGTKSSHPLYNTWHTKCRHSGRLPVHPEWRDDFWAFVRDIPPKPSSEHSLRRRDPDAGFIPGNLYWKEKIPSLDRAKYMREWNRRNPEKAKSNNLKRHYGITLDEYNEIHVKQGGVCAICHQPETAKRKGSTETRDLAVDHCHDKGHVRGLLCSACNTAIGLLNEDPKTFQAAVDYLTAD